MSRLAPYYLTKVFRQVRLYCRKQNLISVWGRLGLLLLASVLSSLWVAAGHVDAETLFQSPVSPPIQSPVAQPPVEQSPIPQPPLEQAPVLPSPVAQPVEQAPAQPLPTLPPPVVPTAEPIHQDREEEPLDEAESGNPANFILDQAELIDTVVVSGAYIWLCCGVSLLLLAPLVLLFVHIRGRSKIIQEEGY